MHGLDDRMDHIYILNRKIQVEQLQCKCKRENSFPTIQYGIRMNRIVSTHNRAWQSLWFSIISRRWAVWLGINAKRFNPATYNMWRTRPDLDDKRDVLKRAICYVEQRFF